MKKDQKVKDYKKLPIQLEAPYMNECGTHLRLAIIQASSYGTAWMASHFDIFMNPEFKIYYGHVNDVYRMEYYNDILEFNEIDYWSVTPEKIVDLLISEINNNHYMVVYLRKEATGNREHLFYGYDKIKRIFYVSTLSHGRFRGETYTFEEIEAYFSDFRAYNLAFPEGYALVNAQFYPITRIKLRDDYNAQDCYYAVFKRFLDEIEGKTHIVQTYNNDKQAVDPKIYHTGLACLPGMEDRIYQYIRDRSFIVKDQVLKSLARELKWNLQKLSDHRYIIFSSMQWLLTKFEIVDDTIYPVIAAYETCCRTMKQLANMAAKFELTENWDILERIETLLKTRYTEEKEILQSFADKIGAMYFKQKLYPALA